MNITEFLEARIAEDEATAGAFDVFTGRAPLNKRRRLAECAAKRAILGYFEMLCEQEKQADVFGYHATGLLVAIRKLAAIYSDHHDYQEDWG